MHRPKALTVAIAVGERTSEAIPYSWFDAAHFHIGSDFAGNHVSYVGVEELGGTEATVKTAATLVAGTHYDAAEITTEVTNHLSSWHTFPAHLAGMRSLKIVSSRVQTAAQTIIICGHGPDDQ